MDEVINDILNALREGDISQAELDALLRAQSKKLHDGRKRIAKKYIMPFFLKEKERKSALWQSWNVTPELEEQFKHLLKMKPRRTASGVATITIITKPWPCCGSCVFCPNDIRMPKSYLHDEPACQRAERNYFDPYLQVVSRLNALIAMGHATDKVELIVLGGTWTGYPATYRFWFVTRLFEALNDAPEMRTYKEAAIRASYQQAGIADGAEELTSFVQKIQQDLNAHRLTYNEAFVKLYGPDSSWGHIASEQCATIDQLHYQHIQNEHAEHRVVGLVVETRPDALTPDTLRELRTIGCTKIQMGIQSLFFDIRAQNGRPISQSSIDKAFELCRLFGFKSHIHHMINLAGSTPATDRDDYRMLVEDIRYLPDEIKLYPCALIASSDLEQLYTQGKWEPYSEDTLVALLADDLKITPAYTRVSRIIRDFSAHDIVAGNKKTNLRQMVEASLANELETIQEIRVREVGVETFNIEELTLQSIPYETTVSQEYFLQMVTPEGKIAGFLRLSLPNIDLVKGYKESLPIREGEAMIREVHVYGFAAQIAQEGRSMQHHGLGKHLIEKASDIAREAGYTHLNVISAVGTREYYRKLGFVDNDLYQQKPL